MSLTIQPYASVHNNPQGEGDARPTALQIIKDEGLINKMTDKVMLVTGSSSGIGIETVRALHATGAHSKEFFPQLCFLDFERSVY